MKINALALIICVLAVVFALGNVAHAAPKQVPPDLLDAKPTATFVNVARWEAAQKEKERRGRRTWIFHGDGHTTIVLEGQPMPIPRIDWAYWLSKDTPTK
ncbi:MAG: hypothetical protein CO029_02100 [Candidatus Magasanikbacteria bacterium CG_4_9_14_0_2_um_filter_41_10]|uniref:Uncharacterized protein n=1 Tax=Candidatus Magasanikbacteria bacterium CG_4_10_14_0_2_um_filter_41_31 TaxID=1974639 RepID=A0A2M7V1M6_9BACT|nr:MAG: hypothetical protein AUJ37_02655 [Candidatus Magasanikbacteria bacterium CG1_02_41_34]PIZ92216.1 MAG: hypothetical protein COX83_04860 [Candidatus Magasanikbacteria bacterium CG_4_10_14_0_2_um_filter_41_31]PJC53547.1 MAG: hypothetical protein CO029_02100 [Candidatus Magasanikbacteria bacterium CG_4_9_14_0_2_um_filter_41_10]